MQLFVSSLIVCIVAVVFYSTSLLSSQLTSLLRQLQLSSQLLTTTANNNIIRPSFLGADTANTKHILRHPSSSSAALKSVNMTAPRRIQKAFLATEQAEGAGARVRRSIGTPNLRNLSPFLMLDHASVSPGAGFPDHPHRGQETITYMLNGAIDHEDFAGNKGTIETGDLQFMTAGRGIMHAEMPRPNPDGTPNVGLQLWVDLPEKLKFVEPRYRDLRASEIPRITVDDGKVAIKIISGQSHGTDSVQELAYTPVWIFDITIQPGGRVTQPLPLGWNAFAYTLKGSTTFGSAAADKDGKVDDDQTTVGQYHNVVFKREGDSVTAHVDKDAPEPAQFLLVAGLPLDQKIVQYGPFVLNSQEEVYQAMLDYQSHANGFERAKGWKSEIGKTAVH